MRISPALVVAVAGLAGPFAVRACTRRRPVAALVVVAAQVSALLLAWGGLLGVLGRHHHRLGLCEVLLASLWESPAPLSRAVAVALVLTLPGRALLRAASSVTGHRRLSRAVVPYGRGAVRQRRGLGTAAVTVGLVRPVVVYDPDAMAGLHRDERRAILVHERVHAAGRHGLIAVAADALAAGLHPWPGAAVARDEVRKHLEAHADERAARRTSPASVARAILHVGSLRGPDLALGMAGWPVWRVERLLRARPSRWTAVAGAVGAVTAGALGFQGSAHALWGSHVVPALHALC